MIRQLFLFTLLTINIHVSFAQDEQNLSGLTSTNNVRTFDNRAGEVQGSPLLLEEFVPGVVMMMNKKTVNLHQMNYDAMTNDLVVMKDGREMVMLQGLVKGFTLFKPGDTLHFEKTLIQSGLRFTRTLVRGDVKLVKVIAKQLKKASKTDPYSSGSAYNEIEEVVEYAWQNGTDQAIEIKNKKMLLEELNRVFKKDYAPFFKENRINVKDEQSLKILFQYINTEQ